MSILSKVLLSALVLALPAFAQVPEGLRANYQVSLREGNLSQTIRAASDVVPGQPIAYAMGRYRISLTIELGKVDDYVLKVAVASLGQPTEILATGSFKGSLVREKQGPLEFRLEEKGIRVSGALALSAPEPKRIQI